MGVHVYMQITERKSELAKLEAMDCGKPLDEAAWDIVSFRDILEILQLTIQYIVLHA